MKKISSSLAFQKRKENAEHAPEFSRSILPLSTRYYTVELELVVHSAASFSECVDDLSSSGPYGQVEALILVVDSLRELKEDVWTNAGRWSDSCERGGVGTLLLALTGCNYLLTQDNAEIACSQPPSIAVAQGWALDHGFECVETAEGSPDFGDASRDKVSIPRILEALESTIWSTAVMKRGSEGSWRSGAGGGGVGGEPAVNLEEASNGGARSQAAYVPPSLPPGLGDDSVLLAENLLPKEHLDEKDPTSDFEALLQQAMSIRAAAKGGHMSDEVRRSAAENMLKKLMGLFGDDEDDDDGSAEEGGGGNEAQTK